MSTYQFSDTDLYGQADYDIIGEQYQELLNTCFRYCSTFAVILAPGTSADISTWEPYRIPVTTTVREVYCHYGKPSAENQDHIGHYEIRYYRLNAILMQMISQKTQSLFSWISGWGLDNPNDPTFFREDGSVFFSSVIHEGICTLFPVGDEDVTGIISNGLWSVI